MKACVRENKNTWGLMSWDTMVPSFSRNNAKLEGQDAKKDSESLMAPIGEVNTSGIKSTLSDLTGENSVILNRPKGGQLVESTMENKRLQ